VYGRARYLAIGLLVAGGCGSGSGGPAACADLTCLQAVQNLMVSCEAAGACVRSTSSTQTTDSTTCFDNGVKIQQTEQVTVMAPIVTSTITGRVEKNGALCYTRTFVSTSGNNTTSTDVSTQDASGTTLVTAHIDASNVATVTCPGHPPTVYSDSCGSSFAVRGAFVEQAPIPASCADGTCTF